MESLATQMNDGVITHGFVRPVSRSLRNCELLHVVRGEFDVQRASQQHATYVQALKAAGVAVEVLPEEPDLPDATFVEDTVIMLDEVAVICRPGRPARQPESDRIEPFISRVRNIAKISAPGTIEGGDVLRIGKTLYVGASTRSNEEGIGQLPAHVSRFGYNLVPVAVNKCLHLKTAVTSPADGLVIGNPEWIDLSVFRHFEILKVPASEPWGGNTLRVNELVLVPNNCPQTAELLVAKGIKVGSVEISELQKAEAGLTCLSVLFNGDQ